MKRQFTLPFLFAFFLGSLCAQEVRTYDGSNNNLANPKWGASHTQLIRIAPPAYADKISAPAGTQRQNPRRISNALFSQDSPLADDMGLSDFVWVFGQFLDHDITLTEGGNEPAMIPVDFPDPHFNPGGALPNVMIPMMRNPAMEGTGTSEDNPREHFNEITAWLDASAVYGSDAFRANWLRTFQDGKMKTSEGNLLPYNTLNGEFDGEIDVDAPFMGDDVGLSPKLFVAGDVRANENVLLLSYHTLFVREHNRLCDELILQHPDWQDEQLYQHARKIVGGLIQKITFEEWLPAMGVHLEPYRGYKPEVDPSIINGFSAAAFRLGHTLLSGDLLVMDKDGTERPPMQLREAFFRPDALVANGGLDPFFRGMGAQIQQKLDAKIVDDVRNFLFGPPGAGGLDLAAININRGRERGLADFNTYRAALGLPKYQSFREMSDDPEVVEVLQSTYSSIDDIDAWVGMLAESPMDNALFGETVMAFMQLQFTAIRDGDRFYYENDPDLSEEEKAAIKGANMRDVLMRNTGIKLMQENVFEAVYTTDICGFFGESARLQGIITNEFGSTVLNVEVELTDRDDQPIASAVADGVFAINDIATCEEVTVSLTKNDDYTNGITTLDMVLILKHILNIEPFDSPYKVIAADVNKSKSVSAADLVAMRRLILGTANTFPNDNTSWRFVNADYNFLDNNPLDEDFPETLTINLSKDTDFNFVAIKVGDVNGTADHTSPISNGNLVDNSGSRSNNRLIFQTEDMNLVAGNTYTIPFRAKANDALVGYQFALAYDADALDFYDLSATNLSAENIAVKDNQVRISWNDIAGVSADALNFALTFTAKEDGRLSNWLSLQPKAFTAEAYNESLEVMPISVAFTQPATANLELYQNQPNPFNGVTSIGFNLPESSAVQLSVFDVAGKELQVIEGDFTKGYNTIDLEATQLQTSGVLYYQLHTQFGSVTKKMMLVE